MRMDARTDKRPTERTERTNGTTESNRVERLLFQIDKERDVWIDGGWRQNVHDSNPPTFYARSRSAPDRRARCPAVRASRARRGGADRTGAERRENRAQDEYCTVIDVTVTL